MPAKKTVIFVCTGNVCRSPMAAGLFYDKLVREKAAALGARALRGHLGAGGPASQRLRPAGDG